jgi:hypothetical protein
MTKAKKQKKAMEQGDDDKVNNDMLPTNVNNDMLSVADMLVVGFDAVLVVTIASSSSPSSLQPSSPHRSPGLFLVIFIRRLRACAYASRRRRLDICASPRTS